MYSINFAIVCQTFSGGYNKPKTFVDKTIYKYIIVMVKGKKTKQLDILLVVNMFLTGFDSKPLSVLYVDKKPHKEKKKDEWKVDYLSPSVSPK